MINIGPDFLLWASFLLC